jgi:adenine-specific DNA-methyltransferase
VPAKKTTRKKTTPVEATKHQDKRKNIPTEELSDFVKSDEKTPTKVLYPRDPSLDPQLVWKGKDEQDSEDLEVSAVPIYIQEKIHPKALVENLRRTAERPEDEPELTLFDDFNGLEFEQEISFYEHEHSWSNRMILGDSLLAMTSLAEKEGLKGKVQMIYVDPPYGIKFGSNWQVSTRKRDVKDARAEDMTRQPEQVKAFRDTWEMGIHSYLSYLRDRLVAARELLAESGSIFVQIGDENVHRVRSLMDEVFGPDNFCSLITFKTTSGAGSFAGGTRVLPAISNFVVWYAKDIEQIKYRQLYREKELEGPGGGAYNKVELSDGTRRKATAGELGSGQSEGRFFRAGPLTSQTTRIGQTTVFPVEFEGRTYTPSKGGWKTNRQGMDQLGHARRLIAVGNTLSFLRYLDDFPAFPLTNQWDDTTTAGFGDPKIFVVQTNTKIVQRCMLMTTDPGDLVIDPTCGSGTSAYVAEQWGRRWITIDTSRVALALARTRLMTGRYPYYLLADSAEGLKKQMEIDGRVPDEIPQTNEDVRKGFVYKTVPHVTLKSIANNPDIKEEMSREETDAAIARHAEKELLYDQPYEDGSRIRVTGPFTVESLSPHRLLSPDEERPMLEFTEEYDAGQFERSIIENLKMAGVQNTIRDERLVFDTLEPYAGRYIQGAGDFTDKDDNVKRVAVAIGPEHGTVGKDLLREAAKEARRGEGFDMLIVCGFAFDPAVPEAAKEYGELTVLPTRMNPDLTMGEELLKKTGSGNLFMVFGEPDLDVQEQDGQVTVEIRGLDIYDPTTGEIRSSSTDDIACWLVDTNYNNESFFVRHAYFTGGDKPYDKLKRALKAEIDEAAWESLYSTKSRSFTKPDTGRFAVKVINHYGDEVLKVYDL